MLIICEFFIDLWKLNPMKINLRPKNIGKSYSLFLYYWISISIQLVENNVMKTIKLYIIRETQWRACHLWENFLFKSTQSKQVDCSISFIQPLFQISSLAIGVPSRTWRPAKWNKIKLMIAITKSLTKR